MSSRRKRASQYSVEDEDSPRSKSSRGSQASQKKKSTPRRNKSVASQPQPSTSAAQGNQTQTFIADYMQPDSSNKGGLAEAEALELARSAVSFILAGTSNKAPVSRHDMLKIVMENHSHKYYPQIIEKAAEIIHDVFGMRLMPGDDKPLVKTDKILVINALGSAKTAVESTDPELNAHHTLLCLLLSCIFTGGGRVTEETLNEFLMELGIIPQDTNNPAFGNIPQRIQLYKVQMYLKYEKDKTMDPPTMMVEWGPRAKAETSKKQVGLFVREQLYPELQLKMKDLVVDDGDEESSEEEDEEEDEEEESENEADK